MFARHTTGIYHYRQKPLVRSADDAGLNIQRPPS
jgi:hypothetical protein